MHKRLLKLRTIGIIPVQIEMRVVGSVHFAEQPKRHPDNAYEPVSVWGLRLGLTFALWTLFAIFMKMVG